jgi:hypothetical protein
MEAMSHARCRLHGDATVDDSPACFSFHPDSTDGLLACWRLRICPIPFYALLFVASRDLLSHPCCLPFKRCINVLQHGAGGSVSLLSGCGCISSASALLSEIPLHICVVFTDVGWSLKVGRLFSTYLCNNGRRSWSRAIQYKYKTLCTTYEGFPNMSLRLDPCICLSQSYLTPFSSYWISS